VPRGQPIFLPHANSSIYAWQSACIYVRRKEDKKMKTKILAGLLLAGSTMFAAPRVSFGIGIGVPAPVVVAPPIVAAVPPCPGPGYVFVNGFWQLSPGWRGGFYRAPEHFDHFDRHFRS
jgi:hypothetical protein